MINVPSGICDNPFFNGEVKDDDEFFHITCHLDANFKAKIECGEFVELEKLLPKNKTANSDNVAQLVFCDGKTYFMNSTDWDRKITGVRRWEQAFRVYAAVYSHANPSRASEIWQCVFVINKAASIFSWSNVAEYDFIFRQMMSTNPKHSWAKTYTQMWNICLMDRQQYNFAKGHNNSWNSQGTSMSVSQVLQNRANHKNLIIAGNSIKANASLVMHASS